jgi:hypothetical protein
MLYFLSGVAVTGAGVGGLLYCRPRNGEIRWFVTKPLVEGVISIAVAAAIAFGLGMMVAGVVS